MLSRNKLLINKYKLIITVDQPQEIIANYNTIIIFPITYPRKTGFYIIFIIQWYNKYDWNYIHAYQSNSMTFVQSYPIILHPSLDQSCKGKRHHSPGLQ